MSATDCNTLQQPATNWRTQKRPITHAHAHFFAHSLIHILSVAKGLLFFCNFLQYIATTCTTLAYPKAAVHTPTRALFRTPSHKHPFSGNRTALICNILQNTATHCNRLQHTVTNRSTLATGPLFSTLKQPLRCCYIPQHPAIHTKNTLQRTTAHCSTL